MPIIVSNSFQLLCALEYQLENCAKPLQVIILGDSETANLCARLLENYTPGTGSPKIIKTLFRGGKLKRGLVLSFAILKLVTCTALRRNEPLVIGDANGHQIFMRISVMLARGIVVVVDDGVRTINLMIECDRRTPMVWKPSLFEKRIAKREVVAYSLFDISNRISGAKKHDLSRLSSSCQKLFKNEAHFLLPPFISSHTDNETIPLLVRALEVELGCPVMLLPHPRHVNSLNLSNCRRLPEGHFYEDLVKRLGYFPRYLVSDMSSTMASVGALSQGCTILIQLCFNDLCGAAYKKREAYLTALSADYAVFRMNVSPKISPEMNQVEPGLQKFRIL